MRKVVCSACGKDYEVQHCCVNSFGQIVRTMAPPTVIFECDHEKEIQRLRTKLDEAHAALPDPEKLDKLADWIDLKFPGDSNPEVQNDLRNWAAAARKALGKTP